MIRLVQPGLFDPGRQACRWLPGGERNRAVRLRICDAQLRADGLVAELVDELGCGRVAARLNNECVTVLRVGGGELECPMMFAP